MTSCIIFYLSIGAAIFQILEEPNWKSARDKYKLKKESILRSYPCLTKEGLEEILEVRIRPLRGGTRSSLMSQVKTPPKPMILLRRGRDPERTAETTAELCVSEWDTLSVPRVELVWRDRRF